MIYYFYKIVCDDLPDYVYIGSTMAYTNRKYKHKTDCENENHKNRNLKIYKTIRENGGWNNWKMICIHQQDVENRRMAEKIEEDFRLDLKANMNMCRAYRSEEDKKEYNKKHGKEHYENNKDYYKEKRKEYYENNKDYVKEKNKEWKENNKDCVKEYNKEWNENNKERLRQYANEKIICECGCEIRRDGLAKHKKSKKHIKLTSNM